MWPQRNRAGRLAPASSVSSPGAGSAPLHADLADKRALRANRAVVDAPVRLTRVKMVAFVMSINSPLYHQPRRRRLTPSSTTSISAASRQCARKGLLQPHLAHLESRQHDLHCLIFVQQVAVLPGELRRGLVPPVTRVPDDAVGVVVGQRKSGSFRNSRGLSNRAAPRGHRRWCSRRTRAEVVHVQICRSCTTSKASLPATIKPPSWTASVGTCQRTGSMWNVQFARLGHTSTHLSQ